MGKPSRDKGYRLEHDVVAHLRSHGIDSRRIPLSGGDPNEPGDIEIAGFGLCEAKNRESIGEYLWEWLGENKALFLKRNRREPLVVMRLDEWEKLVDVMTRGGGQNPPTSSQNVKYISNEDFDAIVGKIVAENKAVLDRLADDD